MPKPGEVYERDGERRTVRCVGMYMVTFYFASPIAYGLSYETTGGWDKWQAGATRVEKEADDGK